MIGNTRGGGWQSIPPVTRNLLLINVIIWLAEILVPKLGSIVVNTLGLHYWEASKFNPVQLFTYMFVHDNHSAMHILFNMFALWMFGRMMERVWGSRRFLLYYFVCGIGAALIQELVWSMTWMDTYVEGIARLNGMTYSNMKSTVEAALAAGDPEFLQAVDMMKNSMVTVGASGAIFGILLGFAFVFPNLPLYLFFIPIPIKAKYMVAGYAVLEFFLGVSDTSPGVAHFAHLGGMIFGLVLLLYWKKKGKLGGGFFY